jgi:hypothetical protein
MLFEITNAHAGEQTTLLDKLKSNGCDVIQTSRGLVVSAPQLNADVFANEFGVDATCVTALTNELIEEAAPDVQAFAKGKR